MVEVGIVFDGGSRGNPGQGYGSYQLTVAGVKRLVVALTFEGQTTNNEAEYDTLIAALEYIIGHAKDPSQATLVIHGDSKLVINQVTGVWQARDARMADRADRVRELLTAFGGAVLEWHGRANSVAVLGH